MSRTRPAPSLTVLALVVVVLFLALLLLLLAVLPEAGRGTGRSTPDHCPTAPMRGSFAKETASTRPCTAHTAPGSPSRRVTPGARQPAGRPAAPKAPAPKAPAPKAIR
ncbi:hypothetical protein AB0D98_18535 [Streptomyces sp. NPDC047987]|uniref:hypothetical protein n=1 Tax=unclassified Streptomyces TaxID=2593676 RepID=UPI00342C5B8E